MALLDDRTSAFVDLVSEDQETEDQPRFFIERELGEGGFGKVYLGEDTRLRRPVAIKILKAEFSDAAAAAGAVFDEARSLAGIDHPHVVPIYDAGKTQDGEIYLVSKYIEGCTLEEAFLKGRLSRDQVLEKIIEICGALEAAHEIGVIHRDIKPENILLDVDERAVLIDFGIAATIDGARWLKQPGTPRYMSPEQANGQDHLVDEQSDLYSLGAVLYRGLAGSFEGGDTDSVTADEVSEDRFGCLYGLVPDELIAICQKALSSHKAERYFSASEFARDLRNVLARQEERPGKIESECPAVPRGLKSFREEDAGFFLNLLPGLREPSSGLPAGIHHWKRSIEDRGHAGEEPFRIGLFFGPSGSGKSSLIRAGLLPCLDETVITIVLDGASDDLEEELKGALRSRFPHLEEGNDLHWLLRDLRCGALPTGCKLLIVFDQFEHWLQAHPRDFATTGLARAMRQCDGGRIQMLIVVRDEFWRTAGDLMRELDILLRQGENMMLVAPFDQRHGQYVLERFGRGLGRFEGKLKRSQSAFLERAVDFLSSDGQVSPLRLCLFVQVFQNREWTVKSLAGVRSAEELDSMYLDQIFEGSFDILSEHKDAVRAILKALLPDKSSLIRGAGVADRELFDVAELDRGDFEKLLYVLDHDLRLITPVAGEESRSYQLSHDYLVRVLRHWFAEEQRKSLKGLALLRLEEQAVRWMSGDRKKLLPDFVEWVWFRTLTSREARSPEAQKLLKTATRVYRRRLLFLMGGVASVALLLLVLFTRGRARDAVDQLLVARPAELPAVLERARSLSYWTEGWIREEYAQTEDAGRRWRCALFLAKKDSHYEEDMVEGLLGAEPEELAVLLPVLRPFSEDARERLRRIISDEHDPERGIRAACVMAGEDLPAQFWIREGERVVSWVSEAQASSYWWPLLAPVARHFVESLRREAGEGSFGAAVLLAEVAQTDLDDLIEEIKFVTPDQIPVFVKSMRAHASCRSRLMEEATRSSRTLAHQASLIAALMLLGELPVEIDLKDPGLNAQVIHHGGCLRPDALVPHLFKAQDHPQWYRVLLLILSSKEKESLSRTSWEQLEPEMTRQFANHSDAGVHSALAHVFKKWKLPAPKVEAPQGVKWLYGPKSGIRMSIVEPDNRLAIGVRKFAIAQTEVTHDLAAKVNDPSDAPVLGQLVFPPETVWNALRLCNSLSLLDGLEPCYEVLPSDDRFLRPKENYLQLSGYRLPTPDEWNYAAFEDSQAEYVFGEMDPVLADYYTWHSDNTSRRKKLVGLLLPSQLGLHDLHGNLGDLAMAPLSREETSEAKVLVRSVKEKAIALGGTYSSALLDQGRTNGGIEIFSPSSTSSYYTLRLVRTLER